MTCSCARLSPLLLALVVVVVASHARDDELATTTTATTTTTTLPSSFDDDQASSPSPLAKYDDGQVYMLLDDLPCDASARSSLSLSSSSLSSSPSTMANNVDDALVYQGGRAYDTSPLLLSSADMT